MKKLLRSFPSINILNHSGVSPEQESHYREIIQTNLSQIVSENFYELEKEGEQIEFLKSKLPFIRWKIEKDVPSSVSLLFVYKYRIYSSKFIYDIISRWLVPGKRLNISLYFGSDFKFVQDPYQRYIMIQMLLDIESYKDLTIVNKTLSHLAKEIELGVTSLDQGMRILEIKGLTLDDKISVVQDRIVSLINRKPKYFDRELLVEMQHFFVFSRENFKLLRSPWHMSRMICWQYFFRKIFGYLKDPHNSKRMFRIKLMHTELSTSYGAKRVLGVLIGVSYIGDSECFGEKQIETAIKALIPEAKVVEGSFFSHKKRGEETPLMYLEIEKKDKAFFSCSELERLKSILAESLKGRVEQLMHPIFMPRNEEEVMRNILNLSKQLKSNDDIPQIIIQFDKQDGNHILFLVILLRVVKGDDNSVQELCLDNDFKYEFIPDRIKIVGKVKKGCLKEANVFYVRFRKDGFLRQDHSLDLYRARQSVLTELYRVFSDVRDYNGGMIAKENEIFNNFKKHMNKQGSYNEVLLENFFYSLSPVIVRSVVSVNLLDTSFHILLEFIEDERPSDEGYSLKFSYQPHYIFAYVVTRNSSFHKHVNKALDRLNLGRFKIISSFLQIEGAFYLTLVYQSDRSEDRRCFCDALRKTLETWKSNL